MHLQLMGGTYGHDSVGAHGAINQNVTKIVGVGSALVALNILSMLVASFTPVAPFAANVLFKNFFIGIGVFIVTVGGGYVVADQGLKRGNMAVAGAGVAATQTGYALFGSALLLGLTTATLRLTALGISTVVTGVMTAVITVVVYQTDRSFKHWRRYASGFFLGGFAIGAGGYYLSPLLMVMAGLLFFVGFVVDLTYEIWAVRENHYASDLRNAIGIYVAVMGVFIHVLQWVIRLMQLLDD